MKMNCNIVKKISRQPKHDREISEIIKIIEISESSDQ